MPQMHSFDSVAGAVPTMWAWGEGRNLWFSEEGGDGLSDGKEFASGTSMGKEQSLGEAVGP